MPQAAHDPTRAGKKENRRTQAKTRNLGRAVHANDLSSQNVISNAIGKVYSV